tara:strand:- start:8946 stop:9248 length:303 start_codon:yes stop_codon:yes gene_type:complete
MNIEESKSILINAISDLPFSEGGVVHIAPKVVLSFELSFTDANKSVTWLGDKYVILHYTGYDSGRFTRHRSVHSVINNIPEVVILAWVKELPLPKLPSIL